MGSIRALVLAILVLTPLQGVADGLDGMLDYESKLRPLEGAARDLLGSSVSVRGAVAVVGAPWDGGVRQGAAYVLERDTTGFGRWRFVKKLVGTNEYGRFGHSVAVHGDRIVVGEWPDTGAGPLDGAAYVFERDAGGPLNWGQVAALADGQDDFGYDVDISGDTIVVGEKSQARVYERNLGGLDAWGLAATVDVSGLDLTPVSIEADTVVAGVPEANGVGAVFVHQRNIGGTDSWGKLKELDASDGATGERFGRALSLRGDAVIVGANTVDGGAAYVFERNFGGANNWGEVKKLEEPVPPSSNYATVVAMGDELALVSMRGSFVEGEGIVYARGGGGPTGWTMVGSLTPADPCPPYPFATHGFPGSIALDGRTAIVGATERFNNLPGSVYVYETSAVQMFVTSGGLPANLGGLAGADAACIAEADSAGLPGVWRAFLSVPGTSRFGRVAAGMPIERLDRLSMAADASALSGAIENPLDTEPGGGTAPNGTHAWTGESSGADHCAGFTSTAGNGAFGETSLISGSWHAAGSDACTETNRLFCFSSVCPGAPDPACDDSWLRGKLIVKETKFGREKLIAKLLKGPALTHSDFGTPLDAGDDAITACLYDDSGGLAVQLQVDRAGATCSGLPCWRSIGGLPPGSKGYLYRDKERSADGLNSILLKAGSEGKSSIVIKAQNNVPKGQNHLPTHTAGRLFGSSTATLQIRSDSFSTCHSVLLAEVQKDTGALFQARR